MYRLLPKGPISRAELVRVLHWNDVLLEGGPAPLDGDHLYLLVRDLREDRVYHVVYAPANPDGFFTLVGAMPLPARRQ
jgi:hypothetical protein